jgi:hypothetical protein
VYITVGTDEMIVGVRRDRGMLYWLRNSTDDAITIGGSNSKPAMYGANEILMPAGTELPLDTVLDAAEQFALTGQRPINVAWIRYSDSFPARARAFAHGSQQPRPAPGADRYCTRIVGRKWGGNLPGPTAGESN